MTPQYVHENGSPADLVSVSVTEPSKRERERQLVSTSQVILSIPKGARDHSWIGHVEKLTPLTIPTRDVQSNTKIVASWD